ncbi:unnamed protein product [Pylaiella littoralis]
MLHHSPPHVYFVHARATSLTTPVMPPRQTLPRGPIAPLVYRTRRKKRFGALACGGGIIMSLRPIVGCVSFEFYRIVTVSCWNSLDFHRIPPHLTASCLSPLESHRVPTAACYLKCV